MDEDKSEAGLAAGIIIAIVIGVIFCIMCLFLCAKFRSDDEDDSPRGRIAQVHPQAMHNGASDGHGAVQVAVYHHGSAAHALPPPPAAYPVLPPPAYPVSDSGGWMRYPDPATGRPYWHHSTTGETTWKNPHAA